MLRPVDIPHPGPAPWNPAGTRGCRSLLSGLAVGIQHAPGLCTSPASNK